MRVPSTPTPRALPERIEPCTNKLWALLKIVYQLLSTAFIPLSLKQFLERADQIADSLRTNHTKARPAALDECLIFLREHPA